MRVTQIAPADAGQVADVLCEAFRDYPVMRYVLGDRGDYSRRLRTLIGFFVSARLLREEPVLGIRDAAGSLAAVALVTLPGERPGAEALAGRRAAVWDELGPAERARYETFGMAGRHFAMDAPHHHLNMIGVRRTDLGRGLARMLLEAVQERSRADPGSCGVTLSTEDPRNVPLYERFGYGVIGHARVAEGLESWAFFRPDDPA